MIHFRINTHDSLLIDDTIHTSFDSSVLYALLSLGLRLEFQGNTLIFTVLCIFFRLPLKFVS